MCGVCKLVCDHLTSEPPLLDLRARFTVACWAEMQGMRSEVVKHSLLTGQVHAEGHDLLLGREFKATAVSKGERQIY